VHVVIHGIGANGPVKRLGERRLVEPDIEIQGTRSCLQPREMTVEKKNRAAVQT